MSSLAIVDQLSRGHVDKIHWTMDTVHEAHDIFDSPSRTKFVSLDVCDCTFEEGSFRSLLEMLNSKTPRLQRLGLQRIESKNYLHDLIEIFGTTSHRRASLKTLSLSTKAVGIIDSKILQDLQNIPVEEFILKIYTNGNLSFPLQWIATSKDNKWSLALRFVNAVSKDEMPRTQLHEVVQAVVGTRTIFDTVSISLHYLCISDFVALVVPLLKHSKIKEICAGIAADGKQSSHSNDEELSNVLLLALKLNTTLVDLNLKIRRGDCSFPYLPFAFSHHGQKAIDFYLDRNKCLRNAQDFVSPEYDADEDEYVPDSEHGCLFVLGSFAEYSNKTADDPTVPAIYHVVRHGLVGFLVALSKNSTKGRAKPSKRMKV